VKDVGLKKPLGLEFHNLGFFAIDARLAVSFSLFPRKEMVSKYR
jgi:hypothetical protein